MLLIGMFDSPYVRRVAISMKRLGLAFEHGNWSVGAEFERICQYSPLGRVPVLVMDDGVVQPHSSRTASAALLRTAEFRNVIAVKWDTTTDLLDVLTTALERAREVDSRSNQTTVRSSESIWFSRL